MSATTNTSNTVDNTITVNKVRVNKRLQKLKEELQNYRSNWERRTEDGYNLLLILEKIAWRKYYKDPECAAYQEEFYQDFIKNAYSWNPELYEMFDPVTGLKKTRRVADKEAKNKTQTPPKPNVKRIKNKRLHDLKEMFDIDKRFIINGETPINIIKYLYKIAKKEYFANKECAKFQEEFYQDFIRNGRYWNHELHDWVDKKAQKFIKLREEAESREKNTNVDATNTVV